MPILCQGSIVWARVSDPRGGNEKERPIVIISSMHDIEHHNDVVAVAASTSSALQDPIPENCVSLPYHPQGNTRTKLRRPTVAVCNWLLVVPKSAILEVAGIVPPHVLATIIEKVNSLTSKSEKTE